MDLKERLDYVLNQAVKKGASDVEVAITEGSGFTVIVREGEIDTQESQQDLSIGLTFYQNQNKAIVTSSDLSNSGINILLDSAKDIAKYIQPDPDLILPRKNQLALDLNSQDYKNLSLDHPWNISQNEAVNCLKSAELEALSQPNIKYSEGVELSTYRQRRLLGNSMGFCGDLSVTRHSMSSSMIAEKNGKKERDYEYTCQRDFEDLEQFKTVALKSTEKASQRLGSRQLKTQKTPVIFAPSVSAGLIGHFLSAISGERLYQDSSFLNIKNLNQKLFPDFLSLDDNPFVPKGLASCLYDGEGVKVQRRKLIESGILKSLLLDCYSAHKLGLSTTGHAGGAHNIAFEIHNPKYYLDKNFLFKTLNKGLYITEVMGQGVNLVTGDYSRGCAGFWIENGEIQFPVSEITIAGKLQEMFTGIEAMGQDVRTFGGISTGSLLINQMTVSG